MKKLLRLLIVEDSEDDALLLVRVLRQGGYQLIYERVEDAHALTTALQTADWDLIISDYSLPHFDGMAALEVLQHSGLDLPFIIVSGVIGEETAVAAMKAGAHDYLMKSNLKRLIPAVERELREAQERRARKAAEDGIRMLSIALAQSASLVTITNLQGVIEYTNAAFTRITGYAIGDVVGYDWGFLPSSAISSAQPTGLTEAIHEQKEWHGELQIVTKSGITFWVLVTVSPVKDPNMGTTHFLFVAEDITERKHLEAELQRYNGQLEQMVEERTAQLRQAKEETEVILNTTSDAIALTLANGDIQKTNPAFSHIFGDSMDRTIERLLWVLSNELYVESIGKAFLSVIYDQHSERIDVSINTDDGRKMDVDLALAPVPQGGDGKSGLVLSVRDISHLKEVERFKQRFVANATHDLSNPITAMKMLLQLLQRTPERLTEYLQILQKQIGRLEHLVGELRTLSELDQGKGTLKLEQLDVNALIAEIVEAHRFAAETKRQQLTFEPDAQLPRILADYRKIERVVVNLVANALNYTPKGGQITVTSCGFPDYITFSVQDSGIGIAEADLPHIFERFYRTDQARMSDTSGTGLGLAITKEMVELHKGTIAASSQLNVGTLFTVRLPYHV